MSSHSDTWSDDDLIQGGRCPSCGSTDVYCTQTPKKHRHECRNCGRADDYRPVPL